MSKHCLHVVASLVLLLLSQNAVHAQFGATLNGVGPVSRSMAGTTTAAPVDTLGAFQWNPATISALPSSMDFGLELLFPHSTLASTVNAGSFAPGFPAATVSGSTDSDTGVFPLPEFGVVLNPEGSDFSYGLGMLAVGGFGVNYAGSADNPMLTPPLPNGLGVGPIFTQYQMMQVIPTVAYQASDNLSIGFSPIVNLAALTADPGILAAPDNAGGGPFPTYPPMNHGEFQWGAGFQIGAFYVTDSDWQYGASFKSTQWFKDFEYNSRDQIGAPRQIQYGLDAPMIISVGTAFTGFEKWLLAVDGRYLNYSNTRGYSSTGFTPAGAISGLGWNDIYAISLGSQYQVTDAASMRLGYSFNTNPIDEENTFYNVGSPLIIQHGAYLGASYDVTSRLTISFAYSHYFENTISGPIQSPAGPIPGTNVTSSASADSLLLGATVTF
ncbi:MAG: outer membrane protein transport protein [Planctomycetales bacterium]|nr:outer membrane protein transport protein [Planctomycetales bacterium]